MSNEAITASRLKIAVIILFTVIMVASVAMYIWSKSTIRHAGERYDEVLGEYVIVPPLVATSDPGVKIREAGDAILDWYISIEKDYTDSKRRVLLTNHLKETGYADKIAADRNFTREVENYLYWTRWLKDYNESMSERYREKGAEWTPIIRKIE